MEITGILLVALAFVFLAAVVLLVAVVRRRPAVDLSPIQSRVESIERGQERTGRDFREEAARSREEAGSQARSLREEVSSTFKGFNDSVLAQLTQLIGLEQQQLESFSEKLQTLTKSNEDKIGELKTAVEHRLERIQTDNAGRLEEMRKTVDEKLQGTLEKRLGESFRMVSERLEQVHKGLGEMQNLASGVGDLKRVLTNVKARGTWGEVQLGNLLEQVLSPDQYDKNVATKAGSAERVEFAIKLPGGDEDESKCVWLPIDAKFPKEDYERLIEASERGDPAAVEEATRSLESRIKLEAKDIKIKYLDPPNTTDFGILFLPTEGLYAEVLRRPGLTDVLQREYRVAVAGPTTFAALLNSLQMGFKTLAIQKRSSEVWNVLGAVKTEFEKFGAVMDKIHKKLQEATNEIDNAKRRGRVLERKLRDVQELPGPQAQSILGLTEAAAAGAADDEPGPDEQS
ncbi:MAG: recombinase RmuC [Candidatus Aminicenantes bacterium RBG_16_63_16]|nr:MAG: recombinase RmuC [Candidatus Aminicenantes bacterium RBG_16_63_16]